MRPNSKGFTLIELIIFIVIVSVGLAGVMTSLNISNKNSSDPLQSKQALAVAEALLEEILLKNYSDPDGTQVGETRTSYDNVLDFDALGGGATAVPLNSLGNSWPGSYIPTVEIVATTLGPAGSTVSAYQITVIVVYGNNSLALTGYRASY